MGIVVNCAPFGGVTNTQEQLIIAVYESRLHTARFSVFSRETGNIDFYIKLCHLKMLAANGKQNHLSVGFKHGPHS